MRQKPLALAGRRVLLIGLGGRQGGVGVARYLVEQGAEVRVTDLRNAEQLAPSLADLAGLPIGWTLGAHREEDIAWADVVVRNPAVPAESPWLALARSLGKPVEMEMTLFFRACPAPIVGVTGTKGKTTTTTLLHAMLRQHWPGSVLAGNMGVSALQQLPHLETGVPVAIELSSFQLEGLDEHRLSPHVAVLTNLSPDHLDRYSSFDDYAKSKSAIFRWQTPRVDYVVFDPGDPRVKALTADAPGQWVLFGSGYGHGLKPDVWVEDGHFWAAWEHEPVDLGPVSALRVPGQHLWLNAMAAAAAALAVGVSAREIRQAIAGFAGVPHRLEPVTTVGGVEFVNDTAATAPAAAIAALRAFAGRGIVVISGGFDKKLPMEDLADELARSARHIVLLAGTVTPTLERLLAERAIQPAGAPASSMQEAVDRAASLAEPGDIVLLSPGCASFGLFRDEFHRGEEFRAAVQRLERDAQ
ncbi:MAG TPA: UDP-N-acetylmuramoyl-L-alanine--D-glutamate ligase [Chloroflexi bacterium]|nr:UDP-N-acetylmuramoyl-L-alanine--D-glutamate ligase [Chloroflexota bacterium]